MKAIFSKILEERPGTRQDFILWPLLLSNLAEAIAFMFFTHTTAVQTSVLYSLTVAHLSNTIVSVWGAVALVVVIGAFVGMYARKKWLGLAVTQAGAALWLYATILYMMHGFWLQVFFAGIPQLMFWVWWYVKVRNYHIEDDVWNDRL